MFIGYIYKITNLINNKIYIGQVYNKTIADRFKRHIKEANSLSKSVIDRAIYKYGPENFIYCEIDKCNTTKKDLNEKEIYWIKYYNSTNKNIGYNLTRGGDGGNTYEFKTPEEMNSIKNKISKANFGKNNGMAKDIYALNIKTNLIIHFDTLHEACIYFNVKQKSIFTSRAENKAKTFWKNEWTFSYDKKFFNTSLIKNLDRSTLKGIPVKIIDLNSNNEFVLPSIKRGNKFLKTNLKFKNNIALFKNFKIIKLL